MLTPEIPCVAMESPNRPKRFDAGTYDWDFRVENPQLCSEVRIEFQWPFKVRGLARSCPKRYVVIEILLMKTFLFHPVCMYV